MTAPITAPEALAEAAAELGRHPAIGLDTEFLRERTYFAQLCLVQLSHPGGALCVDTLALPSLAPLAPLMGASGPVKVLHATRQDQEVLWPVVGVLEPLFDTQVAAALVGLPAQAGYGDVVRELLGVELHKSQTRTDWSRRPLSAAQIDYALDDVRHLLPLREVLVERLERLGRLAWFEEEMRAVGGESFAVDPGLAWQRFKGFAELDPPRQRLATALCGWREQRAVESNRPRGWILPDPALRDIVMQVPRSEAQLERLRELPEGMRRNSGAQLLRLVAAAEVPTPPPPLPQRRRPDPEQLATVARLADALKHVASELAVAPEVLATRRELERLANGGRDGPSQQGWRRSVVGEPLLAAL
jgi:ribonuclease D